MASIQWVTAAAVWGTQGVDFNKPLLAEFDGDRFLPDFLNLMASQTPADLASDAHKPKMTKLDDGTPQLRLYQPLHGRYYLVTGSLVCRKLGLPDRTVLRKNGEKTSFVLRRLITDSNNVTAEYGWVKNGSQGAQGSWQLVVDSTGSPNPQALLPNEERQPMHLGKTCTPLPLTTGILPPSPIQTACDQRTVYYGYIPVSSREKYLAPASAVDIAQAIHDNGGDLRLEDVQTRVINVWRGLYIDPAKSQLNKLSPDQKKEQLAQISLYLILDLGDFLKNNLPDVFNALAPNSGKLDGKPKQQALIDELGKVYMPTSADKSGEITLADALYKLEDKLSLLQGQGNEPTDTYDISQAYTKDSSSPPQHILITPSPYLDVPNVPPPPDGGPLYVLFRDALNEGGTPVQVPSELADLIKVERQLGDQYFIRLVYEHDPCVPVLSQPSVSFVFAKAVDPDAPARHIRIELPSIKPKDLRKFKRGVGMERSRELCGLMNSLSNPLGILTGGGISLGGSCNLGMICSFSIQIIFIIAFILMFIFLILLNIVFWWIAFFKICFPVPKKITG